MKPSIDELTAFLEEASHTPVPPPGEPFLRRLEGRLVAQARGEQLLAADRPAGGFQRAFVRFAPVMAAAAVLVAAVTVPGRTTQRIDTSRETPVTSAPTTLPPVTTTEVPAPVETTLPVPEPEREPETTEPEPTTTVKPTTTTVKPKPTTTTVKPTTTVAEKPTTTLAEKPTTTLAEKPAYESLAVECKAGAIEGRPVVTCSWSASASPDFGHYRLYRKAPDGTQAKIFVSEQRELTTFTDREVVAGATYKYWVEVKSTAVQLIGTGGPVLVACC